MLVSQQSVLHQGTQKTSVYSVAMDYLHAQMVKYAASMGVDTHAFLKKQVRIFLNYLCYCKRSTCIKLTGGGGGGNLLF